MAKKSTEGARLYGRTIYLEATREQDLQALDIRLTECDNARLFRHTYETTYENIDIILATPERRSNTYTVGSCTTGRAIGWVLCRLSADHLECTEFVSRSGRPELSTELLSILGVLAFEQLNRKVLHVKVGASDTVAGQSADQLKMSLIGIMARQMLQSGGEGADFALYSTTKDMWPGVKLAVDAWLESQ